MWTGQHLRPEKLCCECRTKLQPRSNRYQASSWRLSTLHFTYIYNMVIMCIFYFFFLFSFLSFIFLSVYIYVYIYIYICIYIYIRVSTDLSIDLSLYNTTETSPSDRFRNEAPAPRRATWESSLCLQQWPLGDSGLGVSIVMGGTPKMDFFPPLALMPCDSGRDNQLRVKSPPMIVIIN